MPKLHEIYEWDYEEPVDPFKQERKFAKVVAVKGKYVQVEWWFDDGIAPHLDSYKVDFFRFCYKKLDSAPVDTGEGEVSSS